MARQQKPVTFEHRSACCAVIARCEEDAQYGNATNMRSFIKSLGPKFGAITVKTAVHDLATGKARPVWGMLLQHVGHGFYELVEA